VSWAPLKIWSDVAAKRIEPSTPATRSQEANSLDRLRSSRAADQSAVPPAKDGAPAARVGALPESMTLSPRA
jgi:hypothetical protein